MSNFTLDCRQCGCVRTFTEKPRERNIKSVCRDCAAKNRINSKDNTKKYIRECTICGDKKEFSRPKFSDICQQCSRKTVCKTLNKHRDYNEKKVQYIYFCPTCPSVRVLTAKRKTAYCSKCARIHTKCMEKKDKIYFDLKGLVMIKVKIRHFAYCPECDETRQVQSKAVSGIVMCRKHKYVGREDEFKAKELKRKISYANTIKGRPPRKRKPRAMPSQEAIDKVKELNRQHREAVKEKEKFKAKKSILSEEDMVKQWLKKNKVKEIETRESNDGYNANIQDTVIDSGSFI